MERLVLIIALGILTSVASAKAEGDCDVMKNKEMEMELISANIENINTTKTPEGGPYKAKRLVCNERMCAVVSYKGFITKLKPGHPDADSRGLVKFPKIDLQAELQAMIDARSAYAQASRNCKALAKR